ncbi:tetratricopeptide repeat protein [Lichenibacterium minor]|uniref:protein O-GlcNAc transferase n=1 Tax=Lichenibacterium minor TaxID=2316528 RepID=A0A4Q2U2D2_9HYPH|nr:tetratricopeptide repeat protein [Lichenibacterium minor]RYC30482.1 tetratricopeptide repeat protein [Lichenibacterium minor]
MNRAERRRAGRDPATGRPSNSTSVRARAVSALRSGDTATAETLFARCVAEDPTDLSSLHDLAVVAARCGRQAEAVGQFERVLARRPDHADAWLNMALSLADGGRRDEAVVAARRAIALRPRDPNAHTVLGHVLSLTADLAGAAAACGRALAIDPGYEPAHLRRARILRQMGNTAESLASCDALIRLKPGEASGLVERALTLAQAGRRSEAEAGFRAVLARDSAQAVALVGLSRSLLDRDDPDAAIGELDRALGREPDSAKLTTLRGLLLQRRGRRQEALGDLRTTIELCPDDARGYLNMGVLLLELERYAESVRFLRHAAALDPALVDIYGPLAEAHRNLGQNAAAIAVFDHAYALAPERLELLWMGCWARMHACLWRDYETLVADLLARAIAAGHTISPFLIMALGLPDLETHLWTRSWAEVRMPAPAVPLPPRAVGAAPGRRGPIRLGYLSADFRGHATAALVAEVFRLQNRGRFELCGYNIGRIDDSPLGRDMVSGLDRMVELAALDDREAAERIAADGVDILVDLKGFTTDSRPGILAYRPAPIQVNYLGYPGSMGTTSIDYIVADRIVAPMEMQPFFDEAIVHLPHSYQPNDRRRPTADPRATREAHGLPAEGFVFCCFNANYKLTPNVFSIWMRLLHAVPSAVLWLLQGNDLADLNLREAAEERGIAGTRLVFAPRAIYDDHLARLGLANLFLDTLPVNAHTTASEALWCGVPVLTCTGTHFTSRVAASLLTAVGLPELITASLADYEREALALAGDPARLRALRERLGANRLVAPLFDTPRYVRNYEAALERMVERGAAGLAPEPFAVADGGAGWGPEPADRARRPPGPAPESADRPQHDPKRVR